MKKIILAIAVLLVTSIASNAQSTASIYNTACPGTGCTDMSASNQGAIGIQITGTWSGTITFYGSVGTSSSSTFTTLLVTDSSTLGNTTTTTSNGIWLVSVSGLGRIRVGFTSYSSGTANVSFRAVSPARSTTSATIDATIGNIAVTSSALPTGASTSANQATQITNEATIISNQALQATAANQALQATAANQVIAQSSLDNISAASGSASGGVAGTKSIYIGCIYNSSTPTILNGQQIGVQCDEHGALKIASTISLTGSVDVTSSALPTGASTSALQTTGNTSLSSIATNTGAIVGTKAAGTAATNSALIGGVYNSGGVTLTNGQQAAAQFTSAGALITSATFTPTATSGCYLVSAASNNATNCKASAGSLYGIRVINTTATIYYLRLYNLASAPTCSSATGFIESIPIPASTDGNGVVWNTMNPVTYGTGIGFCLTSGSSSTNNGSAATGVFGAILYN